MGLSVAPEGTSPARNQPVDQALPPPHADDRMNLVLFCGPTIVGSISDVFEREEAWLGTFKQTIKSKGEIEQLIIDFINFCEDSNSSSGTPNESPASDLDQFACLITSDLWYTKDAKGRIRKLKHAPVFSAGEVSWQFA
jgi:hypothetical protein